MTGGDQLKFFHISILKPVRPPVNRNNCRHLPLFQRNSAVFKTAPSLFLCLEIELFVLLLASGIGRSRAVVELVLILLLLVVILCAVLAVVLAVVLVIVLIRHFSFLLRIIYYIL